MSNPMPVHPSARHPHTGEPLVALYIDKHGRARYPIMGAAPEGEGGEGESGGGAPASGQGGAPAGASAGAEGKDAPPWGSEENFDAAKAWDLIKSLRAEKSTHVDLAQQLEQTKNAHAEQMSAVAKALGVEKEAPSADELAQQVTAEQAKTTEAAARADAAELQLAVFKAAGAQEANPAALLDSSSFMRSVAEVDLNDATALGEAIKKAVEANPHFKTTPTTPSFNGGPRPSAPRGAATLEGAIAASMGATR